jgi:hypothetical protein
MKVFSKFFFAIVLTGTLLLAKEEATAQILHDISTSSLTIPGNSTNNYIIIGTTTNNYIVVNTGYRGSITLRNVNIYLSGLYSPLSIQGANNCSNLTPVSIVNIILDGTNILTSSGANGCAALQVEQGAQINISAINPFDNSTGKLLATASNISCGAGIGALIHNTFESTANSIITGGCSSPGTTAGGNIIISSGTITAQGGHGAGIGGGYKTYYDGMIVIYGGIINSTTIRHAAGIGSGCPNGKGVESCYTANSSIIVLPPSQISAYGAGSTSYLPIDSLALAGANDIVYIGDPAKPLVSVHTEDYEPKATIYVDLSQDPSISKVINTLIPKNKLDVNQVKFGIANSSGIYQFNGILQNNTTFFTDANSSKPATRGRPYLPEKTVLPSGGTVVLKLLQTNLSLLPFLSSPLDEGYTSLQGNKNAYRVKLIYSDAVPMNNVVFDLANGTNSDFESIKFFAADSITPIAQPTTLNNGNTIYISVPIQTGKKVGEYTDVLRIIGTWNGSSTGYIRQVIKQHVLHTINATICEGTNYLFKNTHLTQSGVYMDTLVSSHGTDSIIALYLTVYPIKRNTNSAKICSNDFYTFRGKQYNKTGIYSDTLTTINGCDSIFTLQLTVNKAYNIQDSRTICSNELPYSYKDTLFRVGTKTDVYIFNRKTNLGCDSIVTLSLKVNPTYYLKENITICDSELPYVYSDTTFKAGTKTGKFIFQRKSILGCDSIVTLSLKINPTYNLRENMNICGSELPFAYADTIFNVGTETGNYIFHRKNILGCDSIVTLSIKVNPAYNINKKLTIWDTELPYTYTDTIFKIGTKTGYYKLYHKTLNGCDSIITIALTVLPTFHTELKPIPQICGDDANFILEYGITYGVVDLQSVIFDAEAHSAGFTDIIRQSAIGASITVQLPHNIQPDVYKGTIILENNESFSEKLSIIFTINYPASIILQKWNDVLALLNSSYNGGYEFSDYQWLKNGTIIPGETKSYLYIANGNLDINAKYSVEITRAKDGVKLLTCSVTPTPHSEINIYPTLLSKGVNIDIKMDNTGNAIFWNVSGSKVMEYRLQKGENTLTVPRLAGTYLLVVTANQGENKKQLIIVK